MDTMARRIVGLVIALSVAAVGFGPPGSSALVGDATELYIVHGLNLDGQTDQSDGGTNATVCIGDTELVGDLEFGEIVGPIDAQAGDTLTVTLFAQPIPGNAVDCADPGAATVLIDQSLGALPSGTVAVIAGGLTTAEFVVVPLGDFCILPAKLYGVIAVVHAANAGPIDVTVLSEEDLSVDPGTVEYSVLEVIGRTVTIEVRLDGVVVAGPLVVTGPYPASDRTVVYVVGNRPGDSPSAVVTLTQALPSARTNPCPEVIDASPPPPSAPVPETPRSQPVAAAPSFTG